MKHVYIFIISMMAFCSSSLFSQSFWERMNGISAANNVQCFAVDPSNGNLYAGTQNGGGIFKSTNNGDAWTMISNGFPVNATANALAVASNGTVYCAVDKLFQSTDAGGAWAELANSPTGCKTITISSNGNIYVGTSTSGVQRSTDSGASWTQISNGIPSYTVYIYTYYRGIKSMAIASDGSLVCVVGDGNATTEQGVYRSTNDGANWTRVTSGLRTATPYSIVTRGTNDILYAGIKNNIFRSSDNGANWIICDSIPLASSIIITSILTANGKLYASIGSNGVYVADLNGQGWANASTDPGVLNGISGTSLVATSSGTLFYGTFEFYNYYGGVYQSNDSGKTWTQKNTGISNYLVTGLAVNNLGYVFVGSGRGRIDRSTDGGTTFEQMSLPITGPSYLTLVSSVATNSNGAVAFGTSSGIYSSTDNGDTWAKTSSQTGVQTITSTSNGDLFAGWHVSGSGGGIIKSTDNGQTWTSVANPAGIYSVCVTTAGTILAGSYNSGIYRSTDNGANWTNSGTTLFGNVTLFGMVQHPGGAIYVCSLGGLYRSTDDGVTWQVVNKGFFEQLWKLGIAGNTLLFGTPAGLYKSTVNDSTWTNHKDGLLWTQIGYLAADANGYIYAGTQSGLYKTSQPIVNAVKELDDAIPSSFSLEQNYPNPFNPTTNFGFRIPARPAGGVNFSSEGGSASGGGLVQLKVFDVLGREVATLVNEELHPGTYQTSWDAKNQPSGLYFYRLNAGGISETKQMILLK